MPAFFGFLANTQSQASKNKHAFFAAKFISFLKQQQKRHG